MPTALLLTLLAAGCADPPPPVPTPPDATYDTRGLVRHVPPAGVGDVSIAHEAIPTFADQAGDVVGMDAMSMPFTVRDATLLDGIAAGDRVALTFGVRWESLPPLEVLSIEALPEGTLLAWEEEEAGEATDPEAEYAEAPGAPPPA